MNPGQTRIFYNPGLTRLTLTKCDPFDPNDPGKVTTNAVEGFHGLALNSVGNISTFTVLITVVRPT